MTIYVAEIAGRAIAAFEAEGKEEAALIFDSPVLRGDLMVLENKGRPLWDGEQTIDSRLALPEEAAAFHIYLVGVPLDADLDNEDVARLCFLVPVRDPTDDPFDDKGAAGAGFKPR